MGKKLIFILLPILIIGGVLGAGAKGLITIPGITPKKKVAGALALYGKAVSDPKVAKKVPDKVKPATPPAKPKPAPKPKPTVDDQLGFQRIADLWTGLEPNQISEIIKDWSDPDVASVLILMDDTKAAEVLGAIEPARASKVSREVKRQASIIPAKV